MNTVKVCSQCATSAEFVRVVLYSKPLTSGECSVCGRIALVFDRPIE